MVQRRAAHDADRLVHPLSAVRAARNWTYQDLVNVIARRTRNMAARREKAWRWEHWGVVPDLDSQLALAAELRVPESEVTSGRWPDWLPDSDPVRSSFPWTQSGGLDALLDALEHSAVDRRAFMNVTGSTLACVAGSWLALEPDELAAVARGSQVSLDLVERMEDGLPRLRLLEATRGGARARRLIDAEFGVVIDVLERSSYTSPVGNRLYGLAAELGRMAGWASFDAGLHSAAQRYWIAALHAAHAVGDRVLGANILKSMSLQCYDFQLRHDALAMASSAYDGAKGATPRTVAMLALRVARAHAALGDRPACEAMLAHADSLFQSGTCEDDPTWLGYFDESEFNAQVGTCYLDLDQPSKADLYFGTTLRTAPVSKVRDRATYMIRRASAQTRLGNADEAASLMVDAVPMVQDAPSERNVQRLRRVRQRMPFKKSDPRAWELDAALAVLDAA